MELAITSVWICQQNQTKAHNLCFFKISVQIFLFNKLFIHSHKTFLKSIFSPAKMVDDELHKYDGMTGISFHYFLNQLQCTLQVQFVKTNNLSNKQTFIW